MTEPHIALAGNPNVGKSTVFNALTGLHQHTGNWAGKTVGCAIGSCRLGNRIAKITDLPGCYSLDALSAEEAVARDALSQGAFDLTIVVCDALALARNLHLFFQIRALSQRTLLCLNLMDAAKKRHVQIDLDRLSIRLGVPVIGICAHRRTDISRLRTEILASLEMAETIAPAPGDTDAITHAAEEICRDVIAYPENTDARDRQIDRILTGRVSAFPIMLLLLFFVFYLTIIAANVPSQALSSLLRALEEPLFTLLTRLALPQRLAEMLVYGVYRVLSWVASVMLPPMAIFFPLFTILEDAGYLPRAAYNLDRAFRHCGTCGKQALCMCMGFGCNAAGVVGCRIIDSPRERRIAILTNAFVPCNGRFPLLIAMAGMFFGGGAAARALFLALCIIAATVVTLLISALLSRTLFRGLPSSFILELPPYRRPILHTILWRSLIDRTLVMLGRATAVAAPAGVLLWILANCHAGDGTLLMHLTAWLDPFGCILGMDGVILLAFLLAFPANETVIPIITMGYLAAGSLTELPTADALHSLLLAHGWTPVTAICVIVFSIFHWPCSTTLLTIHRETGSWRDTALAAALPTACGVILCTLIHMIFG